MANLRRFYKRHILSLRQRRHLPLSKFTSTLQAVTLSPALIACNNIREPKKTQARNWTWASNARVVRDHVYTSRVRYRRVFTAAELPGKSAAPSPILINAFAPNLHDTVVLQFFANL